MPLTSTPSQNTNGPANPQVSSSASDFTPGMPSPHYHRSVKKIIVTTLAIFLLLGISGAATVFILSHVTKPITETKTPVQQAAELAKQANDAATASANKGDTDGALAHYQEALAQYEKAGDQAGVEGVKMQIQYYQTVKANEEKAAATTTADGSATPQ